ncbi:MAG: hypothetical protein A2Y38_20285 [Spirochaetes bacterium GWB1_59_5]|nr:MAG: hypothetical protein A2Y38_20285 [Spirochaetes bacterium GWB1_59_5]
MPDEADRADIHVEALAINGIENARREAQKPKVFYAECQWCGDATEDGARYCCKECATDHMHYNSARERNGGRT